MDQYRHHAFISYAWVDDQPFDADGNRADRSAPAGQRGWVSTFHDRLRKHLGRALGRTAEGERIWIDYEALRGTDGVQPTIVRELNASALLIPIVSRSWFASRWCREELDAFWAGHDQPEGRLCPIWMEPVERDDLSTDAERAIWDRLRGPDAPLGYEFWYRDQARQPRTLWFPHMDPTDRRYGDTQQDMAGDMAARLRALAGQATEPRDQHQGAQAPPETAPAAPPEPIPGDHVVLINGGSEDADLVEDVADLLWRRHGVHYVVPLMSLPRHRRTGYKARELRDNMRAHLKTVTNVLTVFRSGPEKEFQEQLTMCQQAAAKRGAQRPVHDMCYGSQESLSARLPGIRVHRVDANCIDDCVRRVAAKLRAAAGS